MNDVFSKSLNSIIDKNIYTFLFCLLKDIFLVKPWINSKKIDKHLTNWINGINNIIKNSRYFISRDYSTNNLNNIITFVRSQNQKYAGDILEGILIQIFGLAFKTDKDNTFSKYIYYNLSRITNTKNADLENWIQTTKFKPQELKNIVNLLHQEVSENNIDELIRKSPFYNFLFNIFKLKFLPIIKLNNKNKINKYINKGVFTSQDLLKSIYDSIKSNPITAFDKDVNYNSISSIISFILEKKVSKYPIYIVRFFFISIFIYYQNEHSFLMNHNNNGQNNNNKDLVNVPFTYDLIDANIEGRHAPTILSPTKLSNISNIKLSLNCIREVGQFEISKIILCNKNIKYINLSCNLIRNYFIDFFNFGLGVYDNYSLKKLNLSYNYLKENSEESLSKLLSHLKGLKILILSSNNCKGCLSSLFIVLKNLYRKKKIKLENLVLNKCSLDDKSFYELGELLKCKYCKLKKLYLNNNKIPFNINLLKKMKLNKSLEIIHFNKSNINDENSNDINLIISNTNIKHIYLYRNRLTNFDQALRILYRTKLIKNNKGKNNSYDINNQAFLINLDLSNNDIYYKNIEQIKLLINIIEKTTLFCLDISRILYGPNPDYYLKHITSKIDNYRRQIEIIKKILQHNKTTHLTIIKDILSYEVDVKRYGYLEDDIFFKNIDENAINNIIKDKNAIFIIFLKKKAKDIILKLKENKEINKDIIDKIFINDKQINKKEYKVIEEKLVNYMILKRAKYNLIQLYKDKKQKKLILI